jgi:hypothetical protein
MSSPFTISLYVELLLAVQIELQEFLMCYLSNKINNTGNKTVMQFIRVYLSKILTQDLVEASVPYPANLRQLKKEKLTRSL